MCDSEKEMVASLRSQMEEAERLTEELRQENEHMRRQREKEEEERIQLERERQKRYAYPSILNVMLNSLRVCVSLEHCSVMLMMLDFAGK